MQPKIRTNNKKHYYIPTTVRRKAKRISASLKTVVNIKRHNRVCFIISYEIAKTRHEIELCQSKKDRYIELTHSTETFIPITHKGKEYIDSDCDEVVYFNRRSRTTKRHVFDSPYSRTEGDTVRETVTINDGKLRSVLLRIKDVADIPEYEVGFGKLEILGVVENYYVLYCPKFKKYISSYCSTISNKNNFIDAIKKKIASCEFFVNNEAQVDDDILEEYTRSNDLHNELRIGKQLLSIVERHTL